jgi:hypothetical protein
MALSLGTRFSGVVLPIAVADFLKFIRRLIEHKGGQSRVSQ